MLRKKRNLPPAERPGADAKGKYASHEAFFPLLLPKLLYSDAIGDARVPKIGPNEAVDAAVKGIAAWLHPEFIRVWMKKIERWQSIAGSTANG